MTQQKNNLQSNQNPPKQPPMSSSQARQMQMQAKLAPNVPSGVAQGVGGLGSALLSGVSSHSHGLTANTTFDASMDTLNVTKVKSKEIEIGAEKVLLTFDMDYVHGMLEKCTIEHMEMLLKHLDQMKGQIQKKIFERR